MKGQPNKLCACKRTLNCLGVVHYDAQQNSRRAIGMPTPLFPTPKRSEAKPKTKRKLFL